MLNDHLTGYLLTELLDHQMREHPLPWSYERDWTYEVKAADGTIMAKFMNEADAVALINLAKERKERIEEICKEVEEEISVA